jgi:hypothetical protein
MIWEPELNDGPRDIHAFAVANCLCLDVYAMRFLAKITDVFRAVFRADASKRA